MFKIKRIFWKRKNGKSLHMTKQKKASKQQLQQSQSSVSLQAKNQQKKHFISL